MEDALWKGTDEGQSLASCASIPLSRRSSPSRWSIKSAAKFAKTRALQASQWRAPVAVSVAVSVAFAFAFGIALALALGRARRSVIVFRFAFTWRHGQSVASVCGQNQAQLWPLLAHQSSIINHEWPPSCERAARIRSASGPPVRPPSASSRPPSSTTLPHRQSAACCPRSQPWARRGSSGRSSHPPRALARADKPPGVWGRAASRLRVGPS